MENQFGQSENFEDKEERLEELGDLMMRWEHPKVLGELTPDEEFEIQKFVSDESPETVAEVKKKADFQYKNQLFVFGEDEEYESLKKKIAEEMKKDPELCKYIEKNWAAYLIDEYADWRQAIREGHTDTVGDLTKEQVQKLFEFLDKYRKEMEAALERKVRMTSGGVYESLDREEIHQILASLKNMKKYFAGEMGTTEESEFNNTILDNPREMELFEKMRHILVAPVV